MEGENSPAGMEWTPPDSGIRPLPLMVDSDERPVLHELQRNISFVESPDLSALKRHAPPTATLIDLAATDTPLAVPPKPLPVSKPAQSTARLPTASVSNDWQLFCDSRLGALLLWHNPAVSGLCFLVGSLAVLAVQFLLTGNHSYTWLTVACQLSVVTVAANFVRSMVSSSKRSLADTQVAQVLAAKASAAVLAAARVHDQLLSASDPALTFKVVVLLWSLAVMSRTFSAWTLVTAAFFAAWSLPALYNQHSGAVNALCGSTKRFSMRQWDKLGLSRKQKVALLAVVTLGLWLHSSWGTRMMTLFLGLLAVRCNLKPAEVDAIIHSAQPYTQSVRKQARRVSIAATDFARKSLVLKQKAHHG